MNMHFVYINEPESNPRRKYTGVTNNIERRLAEHNDKESVHTSKQDSWKLRCYIAFSDRQKAEAFEQYLKSHSGRAFAKKHF